MEPRCVTFKVHEAVEGKLFTSDIGEWAALTRQKLTMPVEMALQRILTAEDMLSFTVSLVSQVHLLPQLHNPDLYRQTLDPARPFRLNHILQPSSYG